MSLPLFTNNASTALARAITPPDTILQLTAGTGQYFPSPTGGNYFMLTLVQINNPEVAEIVKCIGRTGDFLTVERGQENTQPQIFNISDNVQLRITAQSLNLFAQGGGGGGGGAATQVVEFTATQGQTVFTIPFSYVPDNYNLAVFVNGSKQIIDVNYSESSSTSITFFTGLNVGDLVEVIYNLPIAAGQIDASNILYDQGGIGAVESTVQKKLQESVSVLDFGAIGDGTTNNYTAFQNAIAAIPAAGGVLHIPAGTYYLGTSGLLISRSNISIVGEGMPAIAPDDSHLIGGTILQGNIVIDGNNINISNFGVDCGTTFVNAHYSGNGIDGLVVHNVAQTGTLNTNINVSNVVGLAKLATSIADSTAAVHGVLLESLQYVNGSNIVGCGGWFGVVLKVSNGNFSGIYGKDSDTIAVQLKSDSYAPVSDVNISNVYVTNTLAPRTYEGFAIISEATQLHNVTASNVNIDGVWLGGRIDCSASNPGYAIALSNVSVTNSQGGIDVRGPAYAVVIDNLTVWEPSSGYGLSISGDPVSNQTPETVTASNVRVAVVSGSAGGVLFTASPSPAHHVLNNINVASAGGAIGAKSTININSQVTMGQSYGTILGSNNPATLVNGWAVAYSGQSVGVIVKSGYTNGYGRIIASAATSDTFLQLQDGMVPYNLGFYTTMTGLASTGQLSLVSVFVSNTGACSLYPNRATYSTYSWFNLTDLRIPTELPATGGI